MKFAKHKDVNYFFHIAVFVLVLIFPSYLLASNSANYQMNQERGGSIEFDASSGNYQFKAEVGHPGVGQSTSANYIYDHGTWWVEESGTTATIQWAVPELRVGADETNDDTTFFITVLTADDSDDAVLFTSDLNDTINDGTYLTPIDLTSISPGTYDIGFKGHQHITKKLDNINLTAGNNVLNFTQADNSAPKGTLELTAGDVNGDGTLPSNLGDDFVNSVDITVLLANFNNDDPTGNAERSNLNQDSIVNSVDLSIILANFNLQGDK